MAYENITPEDSIDDLKDISEDLSDIIKSLESNSDMEMVKKSIVRTILFDAMQLVKSAITMLEKP